MRTPVGDVGSESKVVFWLGLPVGEAVQRRLELERALRSERWARVGKMGAAPPWPDLLVSDWTILLPIVQIHGLAHESRTVCLGRALIGKLAREGP